MFSKPIQSTVPNSPDIPPVQPLIRLNQVTKAYITPAGVFPVLQGVSLNIYPGEFLAITGKSGVGKTTLVNMITGTAPITSGEVWVGSVNVHQLNESRRALWRGFNLGVIYQSFQLMPNLNLLDNVMLPMDLCGLYRPRKSRARAMDLLRQVELEPHARKHPAEISGGQQQRVAIARALANDPPILVADEPTGRLDSVTAEVIFEIFQRLVAQGKTLVMVTHDLGLARRVSRLMYIRDGQVLEDGATPKEGYFAPKEESVAE
jgi:putative ABC transport system ATP-binding protein